MKRNKRTFILPLDAFPSETEKPIWVNYPELAGHDFRWTSLDTCGGFYPKDKDTYLFVMYVRKVKLYGEYWWKVILETKEPFQVRMHPQFVVRKKEENKQDT